MQDDDENYRLRTNIRRAAEAKVANGTLTVTEMLRELTNEKSWPVNESNARIQAVERYLSIEIYYKPLSKFSVGYETNDKNRNIQGWHYGMLSACVEMERPIMMQPERLKRQEVLVSSEAARQTLAGCRGRKRFWRLGKQVGWWILFSCIEKTTGSKRENRWRASFPIWQTDCRYQTAEKIATASVGNVVWRNC